MEHIVGLYLQVPAVSQSVSPSANELHDMRSFVCSLGDSCMFFPRNNPLMIQCQIASSKLIYGKLEHNNDSDDDGCAAAAATAGYGSNHDIECQPEV